MRSKATITLDRDKVTRAGALVGRTSMSEVVDVALEHLIRSEELRRDVAAYTRREPTQDEITLGELPVRLDLADDDVDYAALYGTDA